MMVAIVRGLVALIFTGGALWVLPPLPEPSDASFEVIQPRLPASTTVPTPPTTTEYLRTTIVNCDDVTQIMLEQGWPESELAYGTEIAWR
jgi:hypothetical protein